MKKWKNKKHLKEEQRKQKTPETIYEPRFNDATHQEVDEKKNSVPTVVRRV